MEFLKVVVPSSFSFTLVMLYYLMSGTQSKQAKLQETQKDLDRVEHKPILNVESMEFTRDVVEFKLDNIGNGVAEDLEVNTHLYFKTVGPSEDGISIGPTQFQNQLVRTDSGHFTTSLGPNETHPFSATIYLPSQSHNDFDEKFSSVLRTVFNENNNLHGAVYLQFELQYSHQMPEQGRARQFLQPFKIDIEGEYLLENLMAGSSTTLAEEPFVFKSPNSTLQVPQTTYC